MRTYVRLGLLLAAVLALAVLTGRATPAYAWSYPGALNTNAATDLGNDSSPQVTTDGGGNWVAVWYSYDSLGGTIGTDVDILVARSTDNGATWTAPVPLNTNAATDSGGDFYPQVATDGGGNWVAVWESWDTLDGSIGTDLDILVARSTDNGATWTAPAALNTNAATDSGNDWMPQLTTGGGGNWVAVWWSKDSLGGSIGTDWDILVARSTNNGTNWTAPTALNTNAASDSEDDWAPQVTTDGGGNWVAVWWSTENLGGTIGGDADILVARSTDNGTTWTAPAALNTNASSDSGDDRYPQVTADGGGNWLAVWRSTENLGGTIGTDNDILVARSTDNGATWTAPAALNTNAATDSGGDRRPQVATDSGGNWVAVWGSWDSLEGTIGTDRDILVARSTDDGATWTAPATLNTNAATDSGGDYAPQVATDGGGNWVAVWESWDSLGGTIGTDADILFAYEEGTGDSYKLPVPDLKQCDTPWGDDLYDRIHLYVSGRTDVCWWGCALTSAVDVLAYWGVSTTPDALNEWLVQQPRGYIKGGVNWNMVAEYAEGLGVDLARPKFYRDSDVGALRDSLDSGHPVILGVAYGGEDPGHWVVAIGPNPDTWWINDPGGVGGVTLEAYGNTFSRRVVYEPESGDNARLILRAHSPVELVITDPQGRRLGFDPNSGTSYAEIPDASYGLDATIVGGDGSGEMVSGIKTAWLNDPIDGEYALEAIGTGTGTYAVDGEAYDQDGNYSHIEGPSGTTSPGQVDSAVIHYTSQPAAVGGIAELPDVSGSAGRSYIALAGLAAAALVALSAGGWYARRRWGTGG